MKITHYYGIYYILYIIIIKIIVTVVTVVTVSQKCFYIKGLMLILRLLQWLLQLKKLLQIISFDYASIGKIIFMLFLEPLMFYVSRNNRIRRKC